MHRITTSPLPYLAALLAAITALLYQDKADAAIIVSYAEAPGQYNSTLSHTQVFDFNTLPTGDLTDVTWHTVGTYDHLTVRPADIYGGAGDPSGTQYALQGAGGVNTTTLHLDQATGYFGLWWSAGDNQNVLAFYSGETLVARFTTQTLLDAILPHTEYRGNPQTGSNSGGNYGEPYAFVNFYAQAGTTWDNIVFTNATGSGFESDNHTLRDHTWGAYQGEAGRVPGRHVALVDGEQITLLPADSNTGTGASQIPEPTALLLGTLALPLLGLRRRQSRH
ncbi:hypothetical protein OKA04_24260 [Luteolibacter flavescens]|uniref:PEP-CTERM sorting domain-containing protein n=1 Tax=Luteolibacter flavescens TaxID=1859460 RepID=A0ABT3FWD7_9BACT|nr:hypothetical protein [Luteolibacter flavescens]MCW1887873.1 hypothetical protein [Luteolibacter flavescens]